MAAVFLRLRLPCADASIPVVIILTSFWTGSPSPTPPRWLFWGVPARGNGRRACLWQSPARAQGSRPRLHSVLIMWWSSWACRCGWRKKLNPSHNLNQNKCGYIHLRLSYIWGCQHSGYLVWDYYACRDCGHLVVRLKSLLWTAVTILFTSPTPLADWACLPYSDFCQTTSSSSSSSDSRRSYLWIRVMYLVVNKRSRPVERGEGGLCVMPEVMRTMAEPCMYACIQAWHMVSSSQCLLACMDSVNVLFTSGITFMSPPPLLTGLGLLFTTT